MKVRWRKSPVVANAALQFIAAQSGYLDTASNAP
jgi:hypothetical protein